MGRGHGPADGGSRWPRTIAHLAIGVVFVLTARGYAPLHEQVAGAAGDVHQAAIANERACDKPKGEAPVAAARDRAVASSGAKTLARDCDDTRAELALATKRRAAGAAAPDLQQTLKAAR